MKKTVCIILCSILLFAVPFKGYASSAVFFGMSEELVLGYLASLLGIQAVQPISSYDDLIEYNLDLRYGFTEYLAGSATSMELAEWIGKAVLGNIDTSSIIWEKFYEYVISMYEEVNAGGQVGSNNILNTPSFQFSYNNYFSNTIGSIQHFSTDCSLVYDGYTLLAASSVQYTYYVENPNGTTGAVSNNRFSYTYDSKTVYYTLFSDSNITDVTINNNISIGNSNRASIAWSSVYSGEYFSASDAVMSGALSSIISSAVKENIIDGTSVLQLYNPAKSQNGLYIVPDPEDPQDIVIPAILTADWYNFLQQFGSGAQSFVNAYNALNAIEGVSTGAINGLYNNLGIASALNSASAAAQGTLSLTDNNILPQVSTVADAVTGVIPGALTPVTPDSGITNDSDQGLYKLPDLRDFFPFCIPFDFIDLLSCFVADPETPEFVIALSDGSHLADHEISLESFDNIASIVRTLELALFILGLMLITRNLIRG